MRSPLTGVSMSNSTYDKPISERGGGHVSQVRSKPRHLAARCLYVLLVTRVRRLQRRPIKQFLW